MEKLIPKFKFRYSLFIILLLNISFGGKIYAQGPGSLYMLKDNFHSNILNPSYSRNDNSVVITAPLFAGLTFGNSGSFKLSDLVLKDQTGKMVMDLENFLTNSSKKNVALYDWSSVPLLYVSVPLKEGRLSFYIKEQVQSSIHFDINALELITKGNTSPDFKSYNSDNINFSVMGYRELAIGYSKPLNDFIDIGIRGKILFGALYGEVEDWNYGIYTAEDEQSVKLTNSGAGKLSVPTELVLDNRGRLREVDSENLLKKYIGTLNNPGLGLDLGATIFLNEKSWMSASITDIGAFWFRDNAFKIEQNASYTFTGLDISNSIDSKRGEGYSNVLNSQIRDSMRLVLRPFIDTVSFVQPLSTKLALHYQHTINEVLSVGVNNQTIFYKKYPLNIFTLSAIQKKGGLSVFESISAFGFNSLSFGAGIQYEGQYGQIFAVADNLFAVYHPAKNESYSFTFGMSLILNKTKKNKSKKVKRSGGETSPYLPFYEKKN